MRARLLLLLLILLPGMPLYAADFRPTLTQLDVIPLHVAPPQVTLKAMATAQSKTEPFQFAVGLAMPLTLADGIWTRVDATTWSWRTRVYSAGAQTLNFEFSRFRMPPGGSLWIYDANGELVQGPYTSAEQTPEGRLWTPVVMGETAVIEARVPAEQRDRLQLELAQVNHGFRGFGKDTTSPVGAKSGSCNVDVVCPEGDAWRNEIRSVARISIGGLFLCSGQLLNNVRQNDDPLFITANHCEIGTSAGLAAASVVFYWNYQTSTCGGTPDGSLSRNQTGSTLVAQDRGSDFTLLRLNAAPNPAYKVFLAGWSAEGAPPQNGAAVHHPSGQEKRISLYSTPTQASPVTICDINTNGAPCPPTNSRDIQSWAVHYSRGTTEPGSSGGGLWDQNHRLAGVLSGGDASCSNPGGTDYYGRFDVGWTANAAASGQLKANLDPDNSGVLILCGKDPGAGACATAASVPISGGGGGGGGGGSLGGPTLAGLGLLAALRRRRTASSRLAA